MDALGPVIRLDDDNDMRPIKWLRDWVADEDHKTVFYRPGKLVFVIDHPPPRAGKWVQPSALSARLAHMCDSADMPALDEMRQLAKDAIHAFVLSADVCREPISYEDIPF